MRGKLWLSDVAMKFLEDCHCDMETEGTREKISLCDPIFVQINFFELHMCNLMQPNCNYQSYVRWVSSMDAPLWTCAILLYCHFAQLPQRRSNAWWTIVTHIHSHTGHHLWVWLLHASALPPKHSWATSPLPVFDESINLCKREQGTYCNFRVFLSMSSSNLFYGILQP